MSRTRVASFAAFALLSSCSRGPAGEPLSDASVSLAPTVPSVPVPASIAAVRRMPAFSARFAAGLHLEKTAQGVVAAHATSGFHTTGAAPFQPTLGLSADAPLRLDHPERRDLWVEITTEGARPAQAQLGGGALSYEGAALDTDVVEVAAPDGVEEIRLLRSDRAPTTTRYRLRTGPAVGIVRARDGKIEILDRSGVTRLSTGDAFAVDANGARRPVSLALETHDGVHTVVASLDAAGLAFPVAVDPLWLYTSNNATKEYINYEFLTISDDLVMLFGDGSGLANGQPRVNSFDVLSETWTGRADDGNRTHFTATWIPSLNRALLAGGNVGGGWSSTSELYQVSPTFGSTATAGPMLTQRAYHEALLIGDQVYVFGGNQSGSWTATPNVEAFDPGTGLWGAKAPMQTARGKFTATLLDDGKVLVTGGINGAWLSTAEIYDPTANAWSPTANAMSAARTGHRAVKLTNGKVLIVGGTSSAYNPIATTDIYNPATNSFTAGPSMKYKREEPGIALLPSGKVFVVGGNGNIVGGAAGSSALSTTELYDPTTSALGTWTDSVSMTQARAQFRVAKLSGGRVLAGPGQAASGYTTTGEIYYPDPVGCSAPGPDCAYCVDGACCNRPCAGQCEACDVPGRGGVCTQLNGEAPHGTRTACSPYVICAYNSATKTSACAASCTGDSACGAGSYCDTPGTSGTCFAKKANGLGCTGNNQCTSGTCADGVCCTSACAGTCESCKETGSLGTCTAVDGAPRTGHGSCGSVYACSAGTCANGCTKDVECASGRYCDVASNTCVAKKAPGVDCTAASQCGTGQCVDGYCCNSACTSSCSACDLPATLGTCTTIPQGTAPHGTRQCSGTYKLCGTAGACATTCGTDADCNTGSYCNNGACVARKAPGNTCGSSTECATGFCATGVCCNEACLGECQTCNLGGGTPGTCAPRPSSTFCGLAGCVGNYSVTRGKCSGTDATCTQGTVTECELGLKCATPTACALSCASGADCVTGVCDTASGKCITSFDGGVTVDTGAAPDTFVEDTLVAADAAVDDTSVPDTALPDTLVADTTPLDSSTDSTTAVDTGWGVAETGAPKLPEKPTIAEFQRCTKGSECSSGFCVEGVCCDSACTDRCYSCALLTSPGKCTLEPVGVDLKNECGPANQCLGTCGPGGQCIGSGDGTMCARNKCTTASSGVGPAYCPSPGGKCDTDLQVPFDCAPYMCEPAFGACASICTSTAECANGFVCDVPTKTCVPPTAPETAADGGGDGCAIGSPRSSSARNSLGLLLVPALFGWLARRRHERSL